MEADAALVGADGHAVLDAETAVYMHGAVVVLPAHAELDGALGLDQALQQAVLCVLGVLFNEGPQAFHDLGHGLQELGLAGVALGNMVKELAYGRVLHKKGFR